MSESESTLTQEQLENCKSVVDARGLTCPEPVMMLHNAVRDASTGELIKMEASDPSTLRDIPKFCEFLSHKLVHQEQSGELLCFWIRKG